MSSSIDVHCRVGAGRPEESRSVDAALREMDAASMEWAWICPTDSHVAVRNGAGNDFIAQTAAAHPDRFVGCAVANPWFGDEATMELYRTFGIGLQVLFLHPPVQGFQLSDPLVDPLIEMAREYNAPIYAHTGTPICAEPFQLAALARRHPRAKFIMEHGGYADFWYDGTPAASMVSNIWLETSLIDGDNITSAIQILGAERLVFGSAAPLSVVSVEVEKTAALPIPQDDIAKILRHNAQGLLP